MSALPPKTDIERHDWHVRFVPIGDMLAKARIRANAHWKAQWSFVCARKKAVGGEPFAGGPRQTTAIVANGGACRADRATPIEVAHADRQNPPGPSRARFAAVDGGRRCCGAVSGCAGGAWQKRLRNRATALASASRPRQCRGAVRTRVHVRPRPRCAAK